MIGSVRSVSKAIAGIFGDDVTCDNCGSTIIESKEGGAEFLKQARQAHNKDGVGGIVRYLKDADLDEEALADYFDNVPSVRVTSREPLKVVCDECGEPFYEE